MAFSKKFLGGLSADLVRSPDMIKLLTILGIPPDAKCKDGKTLAHHAAEWAAKTGKVESLYILAAYGANMNAVDGRGRSPIDIIEAVMPKEAEKLRVEVLRGSQNAGVKQAGETFDSPKKCKIQEKVGTIFRGGDGKIKRGRGSGEAARGGEIAEAKVLRRPKRWSKEFDEMRRQQEAEKKKKRGQRGGVSEYGMSFR